jgi:hypothetical protein
VSCASRSRVVAREDRSEKTECSRDQTSGSPRFGKGAKRINETAKNVFAIHGREKGYTKWIYHAVLEYEGYILDLDFREPKVLTKKAYFKQMFPMDDVTLVYPDGRKEETMVNNPLEIVVHSIPASEAERVMQTLTPEEKRKIEALDFVQDYPAVLLMNYWGKGPAN